MNQTACLTLPRPTMESRQFNGVHGRDIGISPPRIENFSAACIRRPNMQRMMSRSEGHFSPGHAAYNYNDQLEVPALNREQSSSSMSSLFQQLS